MKNYGIENKYVDELRKNNSIITTLLNQKVNENLVETRFNSKTSTDGKLFLNGIKRVVLLLIMVLMMSSMKLATAVYNNGISTFAGQSQWDLKFWIHIEGEPLKSRPIFTIRTLHTHPVNGKVDTLRWIPPDLRWHFSKKSNVNLFKDHCKCTYLG